MIQKQPQILLRPLGQSALVRPLGQSALAHFYSFVRRFRVPPHPKWCGRSTLDSQSPKKKAGPQGGSLRARDRLFAKSTFLASRNAAGWCRRVWRAVRSAEGSAYKLNFDHPSQPAQLATPAPPTHHSRVPAQPIGAGDDGFRRYPGESSRFRVLWGARRSNVAGLGVDVLDIGVGRHGYSRALCASAAGEDRISGAAHATDSLPAAEG